VSLAGERRAARALALLVALGWAQVSGAHEGANAGAPLAEPDFVPPAAGSYTLHRIMAAPDGRVLGTDGRPQQTFNDGREICVPPEIAN